MSNPDVTIKSVGAAQKKPESSNSNKSKDEDEKSNEITGNCPVTRTMKSFMQTWRATHPGKPLSFQQALIYMNSFRSARINKHIASPMVNMIDQATMCARMLNILRRYDVNHILVMQFISSAVLDVSDETIIANTIKDAKIEWAEMIIVLFYVNTLYVFVCMC